MVTDWQIVHVYQRRDAEVAEYVRRQTAAPPSGEYRPPAAAAAPPLTTDLPDRETAVRIAAMLGVDPAKAAADYDAVVGGG